MVVVLAFEREENKNFVKQSGSISTSSRVPVLHSDYIDVCSIERKGGKSLTIFIIKNGFFLVSNFAG